MLWIVSCVGIGSGRRRRGGSFDGLHPAARMPLMRTPAAPRAAHMMPLHTRTTGSPMRHEQVAVMTRAQLRTCFSAVTWTFAAAWNLLTCFGGCRKWFRTYSCAGAGSALHEATKKTKPRKEAQISLAGNDWKEEGTYTEQGQTDTGNCWLRWGAFCPWRHLPKP
eukprot:364358-Chlamydomonas_euryale.AAC.9